MLKIVEVDESNKNDVIKRLRLDLLRNFLVVYDLMYEPDKTTAYVVYGKGYSLKGVLSIYWRTPSMVTLDSEWVQTPPTALSINKLSSRLFWRRLVKF